MNVVSSVPSVVPEYPKIETIFDRDPSNLKHVIWGAYRMPEFESVCRWRITEKIDGMNIRVAILPDGSVFYGGRTDDAQMPPFLLQHLKDTLPLETLRRGIEPSAAIITLYGEGYGHKIQKGGGYRSAGVSLRVFDIRVGNTWLEHEAIVEICGKVGVRTAPCLGVLSTSNALNLLVCSPSLFSSLIPAEEGGVGCKAEGIVAQSEPMLRTRLGDRVMWKLKARDIPQEKGTP